MDQPVSAADANRYFSRILKSVRQGSTYVVTAHGEPVARIVPFDATAGGSSAREALIAHLDAEPVVDIGRWTRDELYE